MIRLTYSGRGGAAFRVLAAVVAIWAAGCGDAGGSREGEAESEEEQPQRDSVALGLPTPRDTTRPAGSIGDVSDSEVVVATLEDGEIRLSRDTIPTGEVTVVIENRTDQPCALELGSEYTGRWRSAPVRPGGSHRMSMVLATAPHRLFCATVGSGAGGRASRDTVRLIVR
jgi:hypothetical protein